MAAETFVIEMDEYLRVASMDPLCLDDPLSQLPLYNKLQDVSTITEVVEHAIATGDGLDDVSPEAASACLRDLDFLASSLLRHGIDPIQTVKGLEALLLRMGNIAGTVPRSTITTYAGSNPTDDRKRLFVGSREENMFVDGLKASYDRLEVAMFDMSSLDLDDLTTNHSFIDALQAASVGMDEMIQAVVNVRRYIPPEYFTNVIRPYFEPLVIGGQRYSAAGGGQLQLVALEGMLWGVDNTNTEWHGFYEENHPYLSPAQRKALGFFIARNGGQSILGRVVEEAHSGNIDAELLMAAEEVMRKFRKFRYPHRRVAEDNFHLRPADAVGSGSYTPAILASLILRTEANLKVVREMRK